VPANLTGTPFFDWNDIPVCQDVVMPRTYTPRARAEATARTRERIIETARALLPASRTLAVDRIAAEAGVSVQTLYTHFGSKRGVLLAVIDSTQRDVGLYADFDRVWASPDGETALRRMLDATFRLWHGAWDLVGFSEAVRQSDPEVGAYMREVDGYRRANLRSITDRLALERRLRPGLDPAAAADAAFALTVPRVYEELVRVQGWKPDRARALAVDAACAAVIDPSTPAVTDPPADWSSVMRPSATVGLAEAPAGEHLEAG
jgi:AcrR family transcriptional regulator